MKPTQENTAPARPFFSADPSRAMQEMMETIDALRKVYIRETDALSASDTQKFLDIQEEKLKAARNYQRGIEDLLSRSDQIKTVSPMMRARLVQMQSEFSELTKENMEALSRMQRSVERLGNTIRSAARESVEKQRAVSYGGTGQIQKSSNKSVSMGISETA